MFTLTWDHEVYQVIGKSLEEDSIYESDLLVIDKNLYIADDDIVIAYLPDKTFIVKHLVKKDNHLTFYPFHKDNYSMNIDDADIKGKVAAIICRNEKHKHD